MAYPVGLIDRGQAPSIWPKDAPMKVESTWATRVTNDKKRERYVGIVKSHDLYLWTKQLRNRSEIPTPPGSPPITPTATGQTNRSFDSSTAIWRLKMRAWMSWWAEKGYVTDERAIYSIKAPLTLEAKKK